MSLIVRAEFSFNNKAIQVKLYEKNLDYGQTNNST